MLAAMAPPLPSHQYNVSASSASASASATDPATFGVALEVVSALLAKRTRALMVYVSSTSTATSAPAFADTDAKAAKKSARKSVVGSDEPPLLALLGALAARLDATSAVSSTEALGSHPLPLELGNALLRRAWWALLHRVAMCAAELHNGPAAAAANSHASSSASSSAALVTCLATTAASVERGGRACVAYLRQHADSASFSSVSGVSRVSGISSISSVSGESNDEVGAVEATVAAWRRWGGGGAI